MEYKGVKYVKGFNSLTDNVRAVLAEGKFPLKGEKMIEFYHDLECDRVLGIIEFPYIDIELEMWTGDGNDFEYASEDDCDISLSYFICTKGLVNGVGEWGSHGSPYADCNIDFSDSKWEEDLTQEMCEVLEAYADSNGLSFTEPNFNVER